jgi:hypothetical protein
MLARHTLKILLGFEAACSNSSVVCAGIEVVADGDAPGASADFQAGASFDVSRDTPRKPRNNPERAATSQPHSFLHAVGYLQSYRR